MTALEAPERTEEARGGPIPSVVSERLYRGRMAKSQDANLRRLCVKFWQGRQNYYVDSKGSLNSLALATNPNGSGKPPHRIRNTYHFIHSIVEGKVSATSQQIPGYEVTPSTNDPQDIAAASLASQVAFYGYDKWRLRRHTNKVITNALVQREGFAFPYFDASVGPFVQMNEIDPETGEMSSNTIGMGEIRVLTLNRSEVMWEPGEDFEDSRWYAIERAHVVDDIYRMPGYVGGVISPDASTADVPGEVDANKAVVTDYMERPCQKYPNGRRLVICGGQVIVDHRLSDPSAQYPWEPYPLIDADGQVADEPCLHRLSYTVDPEGDDRGLVEHLIDLARTVDDCWNKLLEWKNRCLNPQMMAPVGSLVQRKSDEPGAVNYYRLVGGQIPQWEPTPAVPRELFDMLDLAIGHMRAIASDVDVQATANVAAATVNATIQSAQAQWQSFLGDVADFHSRLMRHCLTLVARHYSEQRQLEIRGQYGWEPLSAFTGQDLRSQVNVRVLPGSIESKSRQAIQSELEFIQTNWPGAITPEAALAALHGGTASGLLRSYELDVARANLIVQRLQLPDAMESFGARWDQNAPNPITGLPGAEIPGWMPRKQDNLQIHKQVVGDFMKTPRYDQLPEENQHFFELYYDTLEQIEQEKAAQAAQQQLMQAQSLGMGNAARPQLPPPLPDRAGFDPKQQ